MNELIKKKWRTYYKATYRIVAFALCSLVMVLSFPGGGRFNYEYEIGRPWRYEDVVAPYDIPVLKPEAELTAERDSAMKVVLPYYVIDSIHDVSIHVSVHQMLVKGREVVEEYCPADFSPDSLSAFLESSLAGNIGAVCQAGIIDVSDENYSHNGKLMLINANVAEKFLFEDLYTPRSAYSTVVEHTVDDLWRYSGVDAKRTLRLLASLPISQILEPNVHYDEDKTNKAKAQRRDNVAIYSGKILSGQLIVRAGDIVRPREAQLLISLKHATEGGQGLNEHSLPIFIGKASMVAALMFSLYLFLFYFRKDYFRQLHYVNLILLLMTFMVSITGFLSGRGYNVSFIIPYVVLPIMLRLFTDSRLAMYVNIVTVLIISFFAFNSQLFIVLHIPAALVACISLYQMNKRIQIFRTSVYIFVFYLLMYSGYMFWQSATFALKPDVVLQFAISSVLLLLAYPLIYVVEKAFGFVSDVSLLELTDGNNELLRELSDKAPGTFQHSMQVANLGQEVAYKIGGNALLVRAGALYHDIGKIVNPMFFTENQSGGVNPHDKLSPEQSAQVIIRHVTDGVKLAKKYRVPTQIRNIIASHHGRTMARYFYIKWCEEHPDETPDLTQFTYPGPRPHTKEEAIIMICDAVEAASKSLPKHDDADIANLVDKIIDLQVASNQFSHAPITFLDIAETKDILKEKLRNIYHVRIQYPDAVGKKE